MERLYGRYRSYNGYHTRAHYWAEAPEPFWEAALLQAEFAHNVSPDDTGTTPLSRLGRTPSVRGLKTFGCLAYVRVPNAKRTTNIGERAVRAVHLGRARFTARPHLPEISAGHRERRRARRVQEAKRGVVRAAVGGARTEGEHAGGERAGEQISRWSWEGWWGRSG